MTCPLSRPLFLDEIGNLSYPLQAKLLTALQRRTVTRLGGTKEIPINIRLISATNHNLQEMVKEGTFREDLLYRMNTICLHLPPLRERKDEIIPLAQQFIKKFSDFYNKTPIEIDEKTRQQLLDYNINLDIPVSDLLLYADESLIAHVVTNLLKNAVEAGATAISTYTTPDDSIFIDISNNGNPYPPTKPNRSSSRSSQPSPQAAASDLASRAR